MPKLIPDGPEIPEELLNELEFGKVVFFCGAGISIGAESKLPNFEDLVEHVYCSNNIEPNEVEKKAKADKSWDKVLGLLESEERLGKIALRKTVIDRLSKPAPDPKKLKLHKALIDLSKNDKGIRLVTTNFDNRFVEAGVDEKIVDVAPKLPIPNLHDWSSLVHLHGNISNNNGGSSLVLTSADFGRAYLTEGWAARFVTNLFRTFTVVFVGYSINDPIIRYMIDAFAAERASGVLVKMAYAFADWDGSPDKFSRTADSWLSKNVEPIIYIKKDKHHLLKKTLIEWVSLKRNPFRYRSIIAVNEIKKLPSGLEDDTSGRVLWALKDPVAAKALAGDLEKLDDLEFIKIERWLNIFSKGDLIQNNTNGVRQNASDQTQKNYSLIDNGNWMVDPQTLDQKRVHLAVWMARHLHVPQLLTWALQNGGRLHPRFRQEVLRRLSDKKVNIPDRLRLMWTILINTPLNDPWASILIREHYEATSSKDESQQIEANVIALIKPRLVVFSGPMVGTAPHRHSDKNSATNTLIDNCAHLKLISCGKEIRNQYSEILENSSFLFRFAETLTDYLELALQLINKDCSAYADLHLQRQSIAEHDQNWEEVECSYLIDLVRDSYFEVVHVNRSRASNLLNRWVESEHIFFKRLALHALTEDTKSNIKLVKNLLLKNQCQGLWCDEMRREVLRFFRMAGQRIPRNLRVEIERAVLAGPKLKKTRALFSNLNQINYEKSLRLCKLKVSGAKLNSKVELIADKAAPCCDTDENDRDEFLDFSEEAVVVIDKEFAPQNLVDGSVYDVCVAINKNKINDCEFRGLLS